MIAENNKARQKTHFLSNPNNLGLTLNPEQKRVIDSDRWKIAEKQWETYNWKETMQEMESAEVKELLLFDNGDQTIVPSISHINFTHLSYLNLRGNNINNIEAIAEIRFSEIESINLSNNYLAILKPLNKLRCKKLTDLYLFENPIRSADVLSKINFSLKHLYLALFQDGATFVEDIGFMAKLQHLKSANIETKSRIKQPSVDSMLKKRRSTLTLNRNI